MYSKYFSRRYQCLLLYIIKLFGNEDAFFVDINVKPRCSICCSAKESAICSGMRHSVIFLCVYRVNLSKRKNDVTLNLLSRIFFFINRFSISYLPLLGARPLNDDQGIFLNPCKFSI